MASPSKGDFRINTCSSKTSRQLVPAGFCYGNSRLLQQPTFQRWLAPPTLLISSTDLTSQEHRVWFGSLTRSPCALTHKQIHIYTHRQAQHTHTHPHLCGTQSTIVTDGSLAHPPHLSQCIRQNCVFLLWSSTLWLEDSSSSPSATSIALWYAWDHTVFLQTPLHYCKEEGLSWTHLLV